MILVTEKQYRMVELRGPAEEGVQLRDILERYESDGWELREAPIYINRFTEITASVMKEEKKVR